MGDRGPWQGASPGGLRESRRGLRCLPPRSKFLDRQCGAPWQAEPFTSMANTLRRIRSGMLKRLPGRQDKFFACFGRIILPRRQSVTWDVALEKCGGSFKSTEMAHVCSGDLISLHKLL